LRAGARAATMTLMRWVTFSALAFVAASCGGDVDERPATFGYIWQAILLPNCATSGCHSALSRTKGISFSDRAEAYKTLSSFSDAILLGEQKLATGEYLPRMPPDQPLPMADIELIQRWILAGSLDD
jgi:cytochrome c551/c552